MRAVGKTGLISDLNTLDQLLKKSRCLNLSYENKITPYTNIFLSTPSWSQTSIEAKDLLEKAKKLDSYISFELEFSYVLNNRIEQINEESKGKVSVSGDRYKLNFLDAIQLFDGENIYTIVPENEEITLIAYR